MAKEKEEKVIETPKEKKQKVDPQIEALVKQVSTLAAENRMLKNKLNQAAEQMQLITMSEVHKKLEWLWKVITLDGSDDIFGDKFVQYCVDEFVDILTPVQEDSKEE